MTRIAPSTGSVVVDKIAEKINTLKSYKIFTIWNNFKVLIRDSFLGKYFGWCKNARDIKELDLDLVGALSTQTQKVQKAAFTLIGYIPKEAKQLVQLQAYQWIENLSIPMDLTTFLRQDEAVGTVPLLFSLWSNYHDQIAPLFCNLMNTHEAVLDSVIQQKSENPGKPADYTPLEPAIEQALQGLLKVEESKEVMHWWQELFKKIETLASENGLNALLLKRTVVSALFFLRFTAREFGPSYQKNVNDPIFKRGLHFNAAIVQKMNQAAEGGAPKAIQNAFDGFVEHISGTQLSLPQSLPD